MSNKVDKNKKKILLTFKSRKDGIEDGDDDDVDDDDDDDAKNARILARSAVAHQKAHATDHKRSEN